jgi:hypothetical protein
MFWSRIGFTQNPTRLDSSGNPLFYDNDFSTAIRENSAFEKAGVKIFTSIIHNGWTGVNKYNYTAVDSTLNILLKGHPDRYYLPRIKLDVPTEWALENPEDLFVNFYGPRDKNDILTLAEKLEKYWDTAGWSGGVPVNEGLVGLQSFSSAKWKEDAGKALKRLIKHLDASPYADQIIGYHIAFGACGETVRWGTWSMSDVAKGDFGINHRKAFYNWCIKKYGTLELLQEAWSDSILDENNFEVPFLFDSLKNKNCLRDFFLVREEDQRKIDYNVFLSQTTADAIEYFGKIVKDETGGKPVGSFYGYLFVQNAAYSGQLAIDQLLNSSWVDFLTLPKAYYRSAPGWAGGEQGPSLSFSMKKIFIDELDNRTHLSNPGDISRANNMEETRSVLWREVAKNLSYRNQNWWWMDLGSGWFDDSLIMDEISKLVKLSKSVRDRKWNSISEILYVIDDHSFYRMNNSYGFVNGSRGGIINEMESELKLVGAPVDIYRLCDLNDITLSQYKLIVFANAFHFEKGQWERIRNRIPKTATIIWNYAAGIRNPDFSVTNVKEVTGFSIEPYSGTKVDISNGYNILNDFPLIQIAPDSEQSVLDKYPDGSIMTSLKINNEGGKTILCAYPNLKASKLREMAVDAGCYMYAPLNCTVYADNRFIGIFPKEAIHYNLSLKEKVNVTDAITGKSWNNIDEIPVKMEAKGAKFLVIEE